MILKFISTFVKRVKEPVKPYGFFSDVISKVSSGGLVPLTESIHG